MADDRDLIEQDSLVSDAGEAAIEAADVDLVSSEELMERAVTNMKDREERHRKRYGLGGGR